MDFSPNRIIKQDNPLLHSQTPMFGWAVATAGLLLNSDRSSHRVITPRGS
jgi:hypothetical protein